MKGKTYTTVHISEASKVKIEKLKEKKAENLIKMKKEYALYYPGESF